MEIEPVTYSLQIFDIKKTQECLKVRRRKKGAGQKIMLPFLLKDKWKKNVSLNKALKPNG